MKSREPNTPIAINISLGPISEQENLLGSVLGGLMDHLIYDRGFIPVPVEQIHELLASRQQSNAQARNNIKFKKAAKVRNT